MKNKNTLLFIVSFIIFFLLIYFANLFFFSNTSENEYNDIIEENDNYNTAYPIDDKFSQIDNKTHENSDIKKRYNEILNEYKKELEAEKIEENNNLNITFKFFPEEVKSDLTQEKKIQNIQTFFNSRIFNQKEVICSINFYEEIINWIRWKFKNSEINLYSSNKLSKNEINSVFIHEFWHYVDINFFEKNILKDISEDFYDISWESSKVLKAWQSQTDFVSWYAMTNKYEDFAESFTYYILDNKNFLLKTEKSKYLKQKYDFFKNNFFKDNEFINTSFLDWEDKDYYWDITKINYFLQNLLNYLKN